jgi:hydrogenase maturation factor HypE
LATSCCRSPRCRTSRKRFLHYSWDGLLDYINDYGFVGGFGAQRAAKFDIGIKGNEEFAPGWTFVFDLESGFDPLLLAILQRTGFRGVSVSALLVPIINSGCH